MRLVTFDPEVSRPAYSIWEDGELTTYGKVLYRSDKDVVDPVFFEAMQSFGDRCDVLVVEDQWIPGGKPERIQSVKALIIVRGYIEYEWRRLKKEVIPVQPLEWTKVIKRKGERALKSEEIRTRSLIVAKDLASKAGISFGRRLDHNIAAAICMGHWFWTINSTRGGLGMRNGNQQETGKILSGENLQLSANHG